MSALAQIAYTKFGARLTESGPNPDQSTDFGPRSAEFDRNLPKLREVARILARVRQNLLEIGPHPANFDPNLGDSGRCEARLCRDTVKLTDIGPKWVQVAFNLVESGPNSDMDITQTSCNSS